MKQKMFLTAAAALVLLFLSASLTRAAEITIDWRQKLDSGMVDDLHFMPGQEQFILSSGQVQKFTEIRSCEDGSILQSYPFGGSQFEFTPDNTKLIFMSGPHIERGELQLRNLSDMSLLTQYQLPKDDELPYSYFEKIAVDPVRPFIYAIWLRRNNNPNASIVKTKILIYSRETLQPIGELTTATDSSLYFTNIAVSKDGKYLAAMNAWKSKLIVWSLDTRQKIVDKYISDQNSDKSSSSADIKFSELNTDKIFFTGQFYQREGKETLEGLCIFSISENRIIDSTFAIGINSGIAHIAFFEYGQKILLGGYMIKVINLNDMQLEYKRIYNENDNIISATYPDYNEVKKFFLGYNPGGIINRFKYQPNTSVPTKSPKEVIYPNPTSGFVNIPMNCVNARKYEIYNSSGKLIKSSILPGVSGNLLTIDFTQYTFGVYFVKVYCGREITGYKVFRK